jgi:hypothetical protein
MRDDAASGDYGAQCVELAADQGFQRLHKIVGVDRVVNAAELALLDQSLKAARLRFVISCQYERHGRYSPHKLAKSGGACRYFTPNLRILSLF